MSTVDVVVTCPVHDSFRVQQVAGMFDVPLQEKQSRQFCVELPDLDDSWQIGAIVGPSGSGKSTIARRAYGRDVHRPASWPKDRAVIDGFEHPSIRQITSTLTAVGFSSPPSWLKPFHVLSTGEQFRCELARALLSESRESRVESQPAIPESRAPSPESLTSNSAGINPTARTHACAPDPRALTPDPCSLIVFDEFTSVVDRTVAQMASMAVAKAIRRGTIKKRFIAVTCHYDVLPWLSPDWYLDMATCRLQRRRLRRPTITLEGYCSAGFKPLFRPLLPEVLPVSRLHASHI